MLPPMERLIERLTFPRLGRWRRAAQAAHVRAERAEVPGRVDLVVTNDDGPGEFRARIVGITRPDGQALVDARGDPWPWQLPWGGPTRSTGRLERGETANLELVAFGNDGARGIFGFPPDARHVLPATTTAGDPLQTTILVKVRIDRLGVAARPSITEHRVVFRGPELG